MTTTTYAPDDGHEHQWERGKHMREAFGVPGNVMACALCGTRKGEWEARQSVDAELSRNAPVIDSMVIDAKPGEPIVMTVTGDEGAIREAAAIVGMDVEPVDTTPNAPADTLDIKRAKVIEPGRVLVTMHYPLRMDVVSGIMRLVERYYPGSLVGEDGTIRERGE